MKVLSSLLVVGPAFAFFAAPFKSRSFASKSALKSSSAGERSETSTNLTNTPAFPAEICDVIHCDSLIDEETSFEQPFVDVDSIWSVGATDTVQGGALKTFSVSDPEIQRVHVSMKTGGRPLNGALEIWHGPANTPYKLKVSSEDGSLFPFNAFVGVPGDGSSTIALRNTGQVELPFQCAVQGDGVSTEPKSQGNRIQGGAVKTFPFDPSVRSVQLNLKTEGRPITARVELLQGPLSNKQILEVYIEDGKERAFDAIIETPGFGNTIRIVNTASMEFPFTASVVPYKVESW